MKLLSKMLKDQSGAMIVWFTVALPMLVVVVALAVDMSYGYFVRSKLQSSASSAALAGASQLSNTVANNTQLRNEVAAEADYYAEVRNTGLGHAGNVLNESVDVVIGNWDESAAQGSEFTPDLDPINAVLAVARRSDGANNNPLTLLFGTALGGQTNVQAQAIATASGGTFFDVCLLALREDAQDSIQFNGGGTSDNDLESTSCGVCARGGVRAVGTPDINLDVDVDDPDGDGISGSFVYNNLDLPPSYSGNIAQNPFPFFLPEPPAPASIQCSNPLDNQNFFNDRFTNDDCSMNVAFDETSDPVVVPAGVHCDRMQFGSIGNRSYVFEPGIHHFKDAGTVDIKTNQSVTGEGVTFLISGATELKINGGTSVTLKAPGEGSPVAPNPAMIDPAGYLFYQNPNDPDFSTLTDAQKDAASNEHFLAGNSFTDLAGIMNFGEQGILDFQGNTTNVANANNCLAIMAGKVMFGGGGNDTALNLNDGCNNPVPQGRRDLTVRLVN